LADQRFRNNTPGPHCLVALGDLRRRIGDSSFPFRAKRGRFTRPLNHGIRDEAPGGVIESVREIVAKVRSAPSEPDHLER